MNQASHQRIWNAKNGHRHPESAVRSLGVRFARNTTVVTSPFSIGSLGIGQKPGSREDACHVATRVGRAAPLPSEKVPSSVLAPSRAPSSVLVPSSDALCS